MLCYSPLGSGLLTGSFDADRVRDLPAGDWRRTDDEFRPPRLEANLEMARRLEPVAERHGSRWPPWPSPGSWPPRG